MNLEILNKLSGYLQIAILIFGLSTPAIAFLKWKVDRKISYIKDQNNAQKIAKLSPRSLNSEQRKILIYELSKIKGCPVAFANKLMDGESIDFANELEVVFKEAGFDVGPTNRSSLNDFPGFLSLFVTGGNLDEKASFICIAFQKADIDCHLEPILDNSISGTLPDRIYIVVGRKK